MKNFKNNNTRNSFEEIKKRNNKKRKKYVFSQSEENALMGRKSGFLSISIKNQNNNEVVEMLNNSFNQERKKISTRAESTFFNFQSLTLQEQKDFVNLINKVYGKKLTIDSDKGTLKKYLYKMNPYNIKKGAMITDEYFDFFAIEQRDIRSFYNEFYEPRNKNFWTKINYLKLSSKKFQELFNKKQVSPQGLARNTIKLPDYIIMEVPELLLEDSLFFSRNFKKYEEIQLFLFSLHQKFGDLKNCDMRNFWYGISTNKTLDLPLDFIWENRKHIKFKEDNIYYAKDYKYSRKNLESRYKEWKFINACN